MQPHNAIGGTTPAAVTVRATYRRDWALFTDWCAAFDLQALPAATITVARFLDFEPHLAPATLRRRVTAINEIHRTAGYSGPGTVTAIRAVLSERDRHTGLATEVIRALPTSGWPAGLFGRRDALILALACVHGLSADGIAAVTCGDLTYHPDTRTVWIGAGHDLTTPATTDPYGLYALWRRWAVLRDRTIRYPSPRMWATALHTAGPVVDDADHTPIATAPPAPHRPAAALFPALDRWGHPRGIHATEAISARAVTHIITTRLRQSAQPRPTMPRRPPIWHRDTEHPKPTDIAQGAPQLAPPATDGVAARRRALTELEELDPVYADIDHRTAGLLARTEQLLRAWEEH